MRGDEVLAAVGACSPISLRGSDFVGRYGGEEFLMLLPSTDRQGALQVAEATARWRSRAIAMPNSDQTVTASVGVAIDARRCGRLGCALPSRRPRALRGQAQRPQPGRVGYHLCDRRYLNELTRLGAEAVRLALAEPALFHP